MVIMTMMIDACCSVRLPGRRLGMRSTRRPICTGPIYALICTGPIYVPICMSYICPYMYKSLHCTIYPYLAIEICQHQYLNERRRKFSKAKCQISFVVLKTFTSSSVRLLRHPVRHGTFVKYFLARVKFSISI